MKKRNLNAFTALCAGIIFLAGMIVVNGQNIGGYTLGKEALKNAIFMTNYTMELTVENYFDGSLISKEYNYDRYDGDNYRNLNEYYYGDDDIRGHEYIMVDGRYYNRNLSEEKYSTWSHSGSGRSAEDMERELNQKKKVVKFGELLADALVGDLKNNVITVTDENNDTLISIDLDDTQIPELYNAGLSAMMPEVFNHTNINMTDEIRAKNVKVSAVTDDNKNFKSINAEINLDILAIDGSIKSAVTKISFVFSDIGTTVIEHVDEALIGERQDVVAEAVNSSVEVTVRKNDDIEIEFAEPAVEVTEN